MTRPRRRPRRRAVGGARRTAAAADSSPGTIGGRPPPSEFDEGSALVEAIVVIAVLLLPLLWVATALIRVEAASFAVRAAAREASRTYVTAASSATGAGRANVAARLAFEDQRAPVGTVAIACTASPCLSPGARVTSTARATVGLPFVPAWLAGATGLQIHLHSSHTEKVEQYGGRR